MKPGQKIQLMIISLVCGAAVIFWYLPYKRSITITTVPLTCQNTLSANSDSERNDLGLRTTKSKPHIVTNPDMNDFNRPFPWNTNDDKRTYIEDIIIAIKSTHKNHATRLPLLLDSWIPHAFDSTFLITDAYDDVIYPRFARGNYIDTKCSSSYYWPGLLCKLEKIFDIFAGCNQKRWYCIVDDDTFLIVPNLVKLLRNLDHEKDWYIGRPSRPNEYTLTIKSYWRDLETASFWFATGGAGVCFSRSMVQRMEKYIRYGEVLRNARKWGEADDVVMGYIAHLLNVNLTKTEKFHSHIEALWQLDPKTLHKQITFSYNKVKTHPDFEYYNTIPITDEIPKLPSETDPTRLLSLHCHLFSGSEVCQRLKYSELIS